MRNGRSINGGDRIVTKPDHWAFAVTGMKKGNNLLVAGLSHPPGRTLPWLHWSRSRGPGERMQQITRNFLKKVLA